MRLSGALLYPLAAYMPSVLWAGFGCARWGTRSVSTVGLLLMALGYAVAASASCWWVFVVGLGLGGGVGFAFAEAGVNALVMEVSDESRCRAKHATRVCGDRCGVGTLHRSWRSHLSGSWQYVYAVLSLAFCVGAAVFAIRMIWAKEPKEAMRVPNRVGRTSLVR